MSKSEVATTEQMGQLQKVLGGSDEASDALKPPATWEPMKDPMAVQKFTLPEGPEKQNVVREFMKTLNGNIKVQSVERIQSMSMWQSWVVEDPNPHCCVPLTSVCSNLDSRRYAVKRQTILMRENSGGGDSNSADSKRKLLAAASARFERTPLFHGTDEDTVPKIITQGFKYSPVSVLELSQATLMLLMLMPPASRCHWPLLTCASRAPLGTQSLLLRQECNYVWQGCLLCSR